MKTKLTISFIVLLLAVSLSVAQAQDTTYNRAFGIGAQVTNPAGITMKGWVSDNAALASVISFNLSDNNSSFYLQGDYLIHNRYNTPDWEVGYLSFYYGVGGRYMWRDAGFDNNFFGIRIPGGLNFNFTDVPFDFYVEMAPVFDVTPNFNFGFTGGLGFRYFLN